MLGRRVVPLACLEGESGSKGGDLRNKIIAVEGGNRVSVHSPVCRPLRWGCFWQRGRRAVLLWGWGLFFVVLDVQLNPAVGPVAVFIHPSRVSGSSMGCLCFSIRAPGSQPLAPPSCSRELWILGVLQGSETSEGGVYASSAQCTIAMTTMLEAAWMQAAPSLWYLLGYLWGSCMILATLYLRAM